MGLGPGAGVEVGPEDEGAYIRDPGHLEGSKQIKHRLRVCGWVCLWVCGVCGVWGGEVSAIRI